MVKVTGVRFENAGKLFYFDPGELWPIPGDYAVVETTHGQAFGEIVTPVQEINEQILNSQLQPVVRVATAADVQHHKENKAAEKEAFALCQKKIAEHKLDMKLVSVEYNFDNSKILFYFTANGRVDFRSLVKDLAGVFRTRIELRQIGVRDEAKMIGGLGPCGRPICCAAFLGDFQPVSIKMAKEQNLSLNPIKISGVCGRLMCCLKYEEDNYEETRRHMPRVGKEVVTPDGTGVVTDLNVIKETVRVRLQKGDNYEFKDYSAADCQRPGSQPAQPPVGENAQPETAAQPQPEAEASAVKPERPAGEVRPRSERRPPREDRRPRRDAAPDAAAEPMPEVKPEAQPDVKQDAPAPQTPAPVPRPRPNAWKQALEQAMKAANGEKGDTEVIREEDHAEPDPAQPAIDDEDDII